ncbi:MAG: hypothetical protein ACRC9W_04415 [Plesiomonas sp.]
MSENSVMYTAGCSIDITLEDFKVRSCVLHRLLPGFVAPTPDEIRFVRIKLLGWPQTKLGAFLGYPIDKKGCATVRRWERPVDASNHRKIEYNAWRRMLLLAGVIDEEVDLITAEKHLELLA